MKRKEEEKKKGINFSVERKQKWLMEKMKEMRKGKKGRGGRRRRGGVMGGRRVERTRYRKLKM